METQPDDAGLMPHDVMFNVRMIIGSMSRSMPRGVRDEIWLRLCIMSPSNYAVIRVQVVVKYKIEAVAATRDIDGCSV